MNEPKRVNVGEVGSTQDSALELKLSHGEACFSFEQISGRGRRGNNWNGEGGVAVTVVLAKVERHFPIAVAATLALQLNNIVPNVEVGIKWPNDLHLHGKKLAGVLIEEREGVFLVGVGVNVLQSPIEGATCLMEFGFEGTLDSIVQIVVSSILDATQLDENTAVVQWRKRDILIGTKQTVQSGDNTIEGLVLSIDPCHNLVLQTDHGIFELPAATSTIITAC
ncbi:MAG: biotin--[acetyl-CoA-carboxylase] ligase [Phycisphaerae bacterium]|nr:biotin--[acetyl-CoA-carboxylase] ligase [Phycisphaerae bacterium]